MFNCQRASRLGVAALLIGLPLVSAAAQTAPPTTTGPTTPPPAAKPAPAPATPGDKSAMTPQKADPMVGLAVFTSDGSKLGSVHSVTTAPDGKVTAIRLKTGGFLGFGGKLVSIPEGKFARAGDTIRLAMTADQVSKLPEVDEQS
ncbi:MAG TPA: PRC-barrel domain-containing protein [Hyphomicrobiaceae bacterium]|nr:PRC-barrel domain-containing protein [Hyphomicrobiaceae bacterium]